VVPSVARLLAVVSISSKEIRVKELPYWYHHEELALNLSKLHYALYIRL